jgi:hypothetical protein
MDEEPIRERRTFFPKITGKLDEFISSISMHPSFSETEIIPMVGTVKLHSAHADVVVHADNSISIQSRNQPYLTAANDVYGMYAFLAPLRLELLDLKTRIIKRYLDSNPGVKIKDDYPLIISGEWIGPGVQKGVAIDQLTSKCFVTISISVNGEWQRDEVYADLENEGVGIYNISRGGFFRHPLTVVDMEASLKSLQPLVDGVECPFAKSFGILGPGEGIVWKALQPSEDTKFWLKIKGSKFNGRAPRVDTNLKLEKADRTRAFADDVVQEWRLEQGWQYLGEMGTERSRAGMLSFRDWLISHVMVEERGVIEKLDLDEEILKKRISYLGKGWYFKRLKERETEQQRCGSQISHIPHTIELTHEGTKNLFRNPLYSMHSNPSSQ